MTQFTEGQLLDARQCQLLVGSFDGNVFCCSCSSPANCKFTQGERECLRDRPLVVAARVRRQQEFLDRTAKE